MLVSPVQLKLYVFSRVVVDPGEEVPLSLSRIGEEKLFEWKGTNIATNIQFGWGDGQQEDPRGFAMRLGIKINNEIGTPAPYKIDVETLGYFELVGEIPIAEREDIAKVNGASLLYGAIRDFVFNISARFPKGALILPSVNFFDLKTQLPNTLAQATQAPTPQAK